MPVLLKIQQLGCQNLICHIDGHPTLLISSLSTCIQRAPNKLSATVNGSCSKSVSEQEIGGIASLMQSSSLPSWHHGHHCCCNCHCDGHSQAGIVCLPQQPLPKDRSTLYCLQEQTRILLFFFFFWQLSTLMHFIKEVEATADVNFDGLRRYRGTAKAVRAEQGIHLAEELNDFCSILYRG